MKNIIIIGTGSIGKRHIANFQNLFDNVDIVDINKERIAAVKEEFNIRDSFTDYKEAFKKNKYLATAITAPPHIHLPVAKLAAEQNSNLFIEKPLGMNCDGWSEVSEICKENKLTSYVAFCHRHIPYTIRFKEILEEGKYGKILHANIRWGSYLPDWHPWEDYRSFYMAKKDQGGGALLDESHGVDLARHFIGEFKKVSAMVGNISNLEISSDDSAFLNLQSESGSIAQINFDLYSRYPRVSIEVVCEDGTLTWDRVNHKIVIYDKETDKWSEELFTKDDLMSMYPNQAKYFYNCITENIDSNINISDAIKTQRILDAAFESSDKEKHIVI